MVDVKKKKPRRKLKDLSGDPETKLRPEWKGRHIKITRSKGAIPADLEGKYTDMAMAERAIKAFYSQRIR